ncbi:N-acetylmuramoyl-L-alanine amidase [Halomonas shantousis]
MRMGYLFIALLVLVSAPLASYAANITEARVWTDAGKTRLVLEITGPVTPKIFELDNPHRLVVDLPGTDADSTLADRLDLGRSPIAAVRTGQHDRMTRLVLDLQGPVQYKHFLLAPSQGQPYRLVLDLSRGITEPSKTANPIDVVASQAARVPPGRDIVVIVDAGHGGKDPGAIGANGTYEKDVVLAIARKLEKRLDDTPGFQGALTRADDTFLSLRERTRIARDLSADFFVSVHADAAARTSAQGSSIYALSTSGASSETARWLAGQQNASLLGGDDDHIALANADPTLRSVLLDLAMGVTLTESLNAGSRMLEAIGQVNRLHKPRVEQAGFVVLKSPDIPSLLVETGFITNAEEERRLRAPDYQARLAEAIYNGLVGYFESGPPRGTWLAQQQARATVQVSNTQTKDVRKSTVASYQIQQGDTLATISQALGVPLNALRAENPVDTLPLQAGATLQLPANAAVPGS